MTDPNGLNTVSPDDAPEGVTCYSLLEYDNSGGKTYSYAFWTTRKVHVIETLIQGHWAEVWEVYVDDDGLWGLGEQVAVNPWWKAYVDEFSNPYDPGGLNRYE
jgi:hypothetical protein